MAIVSEKLIWDEVFEGNVQSAIKSTRSYREALITLDGKTTQPQVLYIEPSLISNNGHQLNLAKYYEQTLRDLGYRTKVIHGLSNSLSPQKDWLPYFLVPHHTMASRNIGSLSDLALVEHYYYSEFQSIFDLYKAQIGIFATIRFTNILAAVKALIDNNVKYCIFGVMEAEDVPDCGNPEIIRSAYRQAVALLEEHEIQHLFIAESNYVQTFLTSCGFQQKYVRVYPGAAAKQMTNTSPVIKQLPKKVRVGYLGGSRAVRHPELIADLVLSRSLPSTIEFHIQLDLNYIESKRSSIICEEICELDRNGSIELYPPGLSKQEYMTLFCSLDIILLPYGERYQQIGSTILIEAIYAGVIPILPVDSPMSELYTSLGGDAPTFSALTTTSIRDAITDCLIRFESLKKTAVCVRDNWQRHPSSTEQWQSYLREWLPSPRI